jgi:hypothetical protein
VNLRGPTQPWVETEVGNQGTHWARGGRTTGTKCSGRPGLARPARERQRGASMIDFTQVLERLDRIETALAVLVERQTVKDWYTTEEAATALGRAEFTVREWCRLGRVHAEKKGSGRGKYQSWVISHEELQRIRREGLLPVRRP